MPIDVGSLWAEYWRESIAPELERLPERMKEMVRRLETITNIAMLMALLVFCATVIKDDWLHPQEHQLKSIAQTDNSVRGTQLKLEGVSWNKVDKTVVMALSTQCHFCEQSIPFYQKLSSSPAVSSGHVALVALFPQTRLEALSFVERNRLHIDNILSVSPQVVGASGTPTVYVVDRTGKIEDVWIGMLSTDQEKELLSKLGRS